MKDNSKRVLHVLGQLNQGGVENRLMDIYRKIDRKRIQFDFVVHGNEKGYFYDEILSLGGKVFHIPRFKVFNIISYISAWQNLFNKLSQNIYIHGHVTSSSIIYMCIAKKYNIQNRIVHARNDNKASLVKRFFTSMSRFCATQFISVSRAAALSTFGKKKGLASLVFPNAIDVSKYAYNEKERMQTRTYLNIKKNDILCTHVGRFEVQKNHFYLIKIFKNLVKSNNNYRLLLIGVGHLKNKVIKEVHKMNLEDKVIFLSITDSIPQILMASDILLLPSFYEGFPGIALEAQASGLELFVSDRVTKEIDLTNNVHFLPITKGGEKQWYEAIIHKKPHLGNYRSKYARQLEKTEYHIDNLVDTYYDLYRVNYDE